MFKENIDFLEKAGYNQTNRKHCYQTARRFLSFSGNSTQKVTVFLFYNIVFKGEWHFENSR
ncbi:hypothetical protein GCM10008018_25900 [Paenibacillus marchantiophytorum]|uniref:Integrase SAM-like N-terminal domain-containing protein n=1 Tax=Paenibacillus marchantiophytorum TaxID=1619310 RepID=A0ABQ1ENJ6_9BACL|nr:hypothetical protein GCM10008018_25900 [Paenibacillus marchantiophytorum]